jgi:uncharacterized protein YndB with AHSA1/START domain
MAARTDAITSLTYTTCIHATPERVWQSLADPARMTRYWRHRRADARTFELDREKGSTDDVTHDDGGLVLSDAEPLVLESKPYRRLSYNWHRFTREWAAAVDMGAIAAETGRAERPSKVSFEIDDVGHGVVELGVIHDGFSSGSAVLPAISEDWPAVLSSLKTLLETGAVLSAR